MDIPIFLDPKLFSDLERFADKIIWHYKTNLDELHTRDKALFSLMLLAGTRISETVRLQRKQFRSYKNMIVLANVETLKHGDVRSRIVLPKAGMLAPFTEMVDDWLKIVPDEPDVFVFARYNSTAGWHWDQHIGRHAGWQIIKDTTNLFPHWCRAVCETIYGRAIFHNDAWKLKSFMGIKRMDSTVPYVSGQWEQNEREISTFKV
jgi:integrase